MDSGYCDSLVQGVCVACGVDCGYCDSLVQCVGHVGWIVVTAIACFRVWDMWVYSSYCSSLLQGVGHVGWIVVTAIAWFRVWGMWGGLWLLQ